MGLKFLQKGTQLACTADGLALIDAPVAPQTLATISAEATENLAAGQSVYVNLTGKIAEVVPTLDTVPVARPVVGAHTVFDGHDMFFMCDVNGRIMLYEMTNGVMTKYAYTGGNLGVGDSHRPCGFWVNGGNLYAYYTSSNGNAYWFTVNFTTSTLLLIATIATTMWFKPMYDSGTDVVVYHDGAIKNMLAATGAIGTTISTLGAVSYPFGDVYQSPSNENIYIFVSFAENVTSFNLVVYNLTDMSSTVVTYTFATGYYPQYVRIAPFMQSGKECVFASFYNYNSSSSNTYNRYVITSEVGTPQFTVLGSWIDAQYTSPSAGFNINQALVGVVSKYKRLFVQNRSVDGYYISTLGPASYYYSSSVKCGGYQAQKFFLGLPSTFYPVIADKAYIVLSVTSSSVRANWFALLKITPTVSSSSNDNNWDYAGVTETAVSNGETASVVTQFSTTGGAL